ncbi:Uma2 family endonuclease [Streptomyces sp. HB202]|nr:Uma2 family endonuclease [Streptomyces sp. HB202]
MTAEMVTPAWMHAQISAEEYDSWSEEQCAGIEIVDGMVVVSPSASKRHNRLARILANALDAAAGPDWNADTDFDVRLQDVPLTNRRADVIVYRAETIDLTPTRPEHVLLVVEVVSPGSETTDRIVKVDQYAKAGIPFYWRVEQARHRCPDRVHLRPRPRHQGLPGRRDVHRHGEGHRPFLHHGRSWAPVRSGEVAPLSRFDHQRICPASPSTCAAPRRSQDRPRHLLLPGTQSAPRRSPHRTRASEPPWAPASTGSRAESAPRFPESASVNRPGESAP